MLVACCDQNAGTSTSRCSKTDLAAFVGDHAPPEFPLDLVERIAPGLREEPRERQARLRRLRLRPRPLGVRTARSATCSPWTRCALRRASLHVAPPPQRAPCAGGPRRPASAARHPRADPAGIPGPGPRHGMPRPAGRPPNCRVSLARNRGGEEPDRARTYREAGRFSCVRVRAEGDHYAPARTRLSSAEIHQILCLTFRSDAIGWRKSWWIRERMPFCSDFAGDPAGPRAVARAVRPRPARLRREVAALSASVSANDQVLLLERLLRLVR